MKIFRFFYKCAIYADPRFGICFHTWLMISGFILSPFFILSLFLLDRYNVMIAFAIYYGVFILNTFIGLPIPDKTQIKITNFLLGVPPTLPKDRRNILLHQLYFYGFFMGFWMIPVTLMFLLDIWGYWER